MKNSNIFPRHTNYDLPNAIRGEGCYIIDENDKWYLDASGVLLFLVLVIQTKLFKKPSLNKLKNYRLPTLLFLQVNQQNFWQTF